MDLTGAEKKQISHSRWVMTYYEDNKGDMVARECSSCKEIRPSIMFGKDAKGFKGKKSSCKNCRNRKQKMHYTENLIYYQKYTVKNRERRREAKRIWRNNNRDRERIHKQRRRSRELGLPDNLTFKQQSEILDIFNGTCALTGSTTISWDHAIPLGVGYAGTIRENMYPLRTDLNSSKRDRCIFDWFYENKERFNLEQRKFDELIEYLAEINGMTTQEYEDYVRWCHANPRSIDEIKSEETA